MRHFLLTTITSLLCAALPAQQPQKTWELLTPETGNKAYVARDYVSLKPGFSYKASGTSKFSAKIDEYLVFPPTEATYGSPDGTPGSTPASGGVVGSIPGVFNVSPTGAATYTIPIEVPAGINGMQPNISLVYNSQAGNGIAGWGWNIGGVSMISRVPKNLYFDNSVGGIDWTKDSPLALDGQRLIKISDTEYRTENESFSKITAESIQAWGPEVIKVQTKEGLIMEYGRQGSTISYSPISSTKRLGWLLSKVYDQFGNYIMYNYSYAGGLTYKDLVLSSATYGSSNGGQEKQFGMVRFIYTPRSDEMTGYVDGTPTRNNRVLSGIEVYSDGVIYRRYALAYTTCNIQKSRLQSVDCYNANSEKVNPTNITWGNTNVAVSVQSTDSSFGDSWRMEAKDKHWFSADTDGDGVSEVVAMYHQRVAGLDQTCFEMYHLDPQSNIVSFKGSDYYGTSITGFDFGDMSRKLDRMFAIKHTNLEDPWLLLPTLNRSSHYCDLEFHDIKSGLFTNINLKSSVNTIPVYGFADLNNDGYDDIIVIEQAQTDGRYPLYVLYGNPDKQFIIQEFDFFSSTNGRPDNLFISDLNGNGLQDLLIVTDKGYNVLWNNGGSTIELGIVKTGLSVATSNTALFNSGCSVIRQGDFNGDGLQDFIVNEKTNNIWFFAINNGSGNFAKYSLAAITAIEESYTGKNDSRDQCIVMDFNNDGKDDVIIIEADYKKEDDIWSSPWGVFRSSYVAWYESTGTGVSLVKKLQTNNEDYCYSHYTSTGDFDGDGRTDLLSYSTNLYSASNKSMDKFFLHSSRTSLFSDGKVLFVLDGLNNGLGLSYKPLTDNNVYLTDYVFPKSCPVLQVRGPLYVASKSRLLRNGSTYEDYEYSYETLLYHSSGKGLLGFVKSTSKETVSGIEIETTNKLNTSFYTLVPYLKDTRYIFDIISRTESYFSLLSLGSKRFVSRATSKVEENRPKNTTIHTQISDYDSYGNPKTISKDWGGGTSETQSLVYTTAGSWCDNMVKSISTTRTNPNGNETHSASFDYYDTGKLKTHTANPGKGKFQITNSYEYDTFGNLTKETVNNNGDSRSVSRTYTPSGRFLKTETNNQLKETVTYNFNEATGTLTSMVTPSGTTKYSYDGFGRITGVEYPDKKRAAMSRQWAGSAVYGAIYYVYEESSGTGPVKVWYDGQGRELRRDFYGLGGKATYIKTEYNSKGQLYRVSEPYFGSAPTTWAAVYLYDSYGRKTTETTPLGATSYVYSGLKTTVTSPSGTVETTLNSAGQILTSKENGKTVTFKYYPSGKVETATPESGAAVSYKYDLLGYPTEVNDPNTGKITYLYNGFGEIMEQSRPIHIGKDDVKTIYTYNPTTKLPETISVNEQTTSFAYDSHNRLKSETISGVHSRTYEYDSYNRPIKLTENISGKNFVSSTAYDAYGRVSKETFPSGYFITNAYDEYGHHSSVTDSKGSKIWEAKETDAFGRLTKYNQGGRTTTMYYDPTTGLPSSIVASSLINMSYIYDAKGQLESRSDGITGQKEVFTYDGLSRLDGWTLTRPGAALQSYNMIYDSKTGGIENKPNVAYTMKYGESANPPHSLTSIAGMPVELKDHAPQTISYNDFSKVSSISQDYKTYSLTYGTHRQRVKSVSEESGSTKQTKYYLGNYEEEVDAGGNIRKLHYIYGSNTLAAIMEHKSGQENLYYTYTDYQGNLMAVTDAAGKVKERYAYDPWGFRKNPTNWSVTDTRTSFLFSRGYTLHEHLDDFGLINMNGRVYDPLMAQFLSPDPYIQAPGSWMNYNRYAYCLNNPLLYTDPTGEFFWAALPLIAKIGIGIGAGVGAYTGYKIGEANGASGLGMAGYILGGAAIGGFSGYLGGTIAAGGGFMANTSAIMAGSYTNSMGMAMLSGGDMAPSISFGVASFNFGTGEFGYLGKEGNSFMENLGYGLGALANVSDVLAGFKPGEVQLNTEKSDAIGHSALTKVGETDPSNSFVSVGPDPGGKWIFNPFKFKNGTNHWKNYVDAGDDVLKIDVKGVNAQRIASYGANLDRGVNYNLYFSSCVNHTARALTLAGAPSIGLHPFILHSQMVLRSVGFRPMLYSYHLYQY